MFVLVNIFEGIDDYNLTSCLESSERCKRVFRGAEYKNNYDVYSMNIKYPIVFDVIRNNAEFCNKHISSVYILNIPCRPDIVWDHYHKYYGEYASSAFFNRLKRMSEISKYKNCMTIPYELFYERIDCVKKFLGIGRNFIFDKPHFEKTNFNLNWKYETEIKKIKKQVSWFENYN